MRAAADDFEQLNKEKKTSSETIDDDHRRPGRHV